MSAVMHCTVLHCTVLHCNVLHCTVLHSTVLNCTALHSLYCTVCNVLYCTYCTVLQCMYLSHSRGSDDVLWSAVPGPIHVRTKSIRDTAYILCSRTSRYSYYQLAHSFSIKYHYLWEFHAEKAHIFWYFENIRQKRRSRNFFDFYY